MGFWSAVGDVLTFGQVSRNQASSDVSFTFISKKENYEFLWDFSIQRKRADQAEQRAKRIQNERDAEM